MSLQIKDLDSSPSEEDYIERIKRKHITIKRCTRCIYDIETPSIKFDDRGVCNYCKASEDLNQQYPTGLEGQRKLEQIVNEIKKAGRGKPYDVVVGVSGGCDSSYMLIKAKEFGLRPLAVHFDNTWNTTIATTNIHTMLDKLKIDLFTHVVDNEEYDDILRAFLKAGVIDIETPTDIGLATTLYMAAAKYGIQYQFEGHSFRTEGIGPLGWFYIDGKYIESVVREFGNYRQHKLKTFPNLWFSKFMKYTLYNRIKKIRPLYWMDYDKEATKKMLSEEYGWQWYGGHHLENRFTVFLHSYYAPRRFGLDTRVLGNSALVRSGQLDRTEAIAMLQEPFVFDTEILGIVKKRLGFTDREFEDLFKQPTRTWKEFKTYKPLFERLRPFFYMLMKAQLVPQSFYVKYTSKSDI